jgi:Flp pilus assembly protein TadB
VDMSPEAGNRQRSPQIMLGWVAVALMAVGVAASFLLEEAGFVFIGIGGIILVFCVVLELRTRKAAEQAGPAFPEGGTFGGRKSPQTHTRM